MSDSGHTKNIKKKKNKKVYIHYVIYYHINKFNKYQIKISVLIHSKINNIINLKIMSENSNNNPMNNNNKNAKKRKSLEQINMVTDDVSETTEPIQVNLPYTASLKKEKTEIEEEITIIEQSIEMLQRRSKDFNIYKNLLIIIYHLDKSLSNDTKIHAKRLELATITNLLAEIEIALTIEKDQQREIQIKKLKEMMAGFDAPKASKTTKLQYEANYNGNKIFSNDNHMLSSSEKIDAVMI